MSLKKLALVTAMFAATSGAFAMEAMDEESLAATTGQDGISIALSTSAAVNVIVHDKDGFGTLTDSGAIVLTGIKLNGAGGVGKAAVDIDIDAGASAATVDDAILNIGVSLGAAQIDLGALSVANSSRTGAGVGWGTDAGTDSGTLLDLGVIDLAAGTTINLQLGNELQGHMIVMDTTLTGGLSLSGVGLNDVGGLITGGSISVGTLNVNNAGASNDLDAIIGVDATTTGLVLTLTQVGDATNGLDVTMANVVLGGGAGIGDVEIVGLNVNGDTVTVSGH